MLKKKKKIIAILEKKIIKNSMFLTISITPSKGSHLKSYDKKFLSYRIGFRSGDIGFKIEKCYIHNIFTINCKWQVVMGYY